jgi:hypothetical protein
MHIFICNVFVITQHVTHLPLSVVMGVIYMFLQYIKISVKYTKTSIFFFLFVQVAFFIFAISSCVV